MRHRQQVVAGGDAGAAHDGDLPRPAVAHDLHEFPAKPVRRVQTAVGIDVVGVGPVHRAGYVAGNGVDRLDLANEAFAPTGVDQQAATGQVRFDASAGTLDLDALLGPSESEYTPLLFARLTDGVIDGRPVEDVARDLGLSLPELPRLRATFGPSASCATV